MKKKRINKSDRLLKYSSNPMNWGKDIYGIIFDRIMKRQFKNKIMEKRAEFDKLFKI